MKLPSDKLTPRGKLFRKFLNDLTTCCQFTCQFIHDLKTGFASGTWGLDSG